MDPKCHKEKMKKKDKIYRRFTCPIFMVNVHFIIGDKKDIKRFCADLDPSEYAAGGCWDIEKTVGNSKEYSVLIWLDDIDALYNMIHETVHLVRLIFNHFNIPFTAENDEMIAYYQNYWIRKIWRVMAISDNKGRNKKNET